MHITSIRSLPRPQAPALMLRKGPVGSSKPRWVYRIGGLSQYLSSCASACCHSLTKASASWVTCSGEGVRPPHISGRAACVRA